MKLFGLWLMSNVLLFGASLLYFIAMGDEYGAIGGFAIVGIMLLYWLISIPVLVMIAIKNFFSRSQKKDRDKSNDTTKEKDGVSDAVLMTMSIVSTGFFVLPTLVRSSNNELGIVVMYSLATGIVFFVFKSLGGFLRH